MKSICISIILLATTLSYSQTKKAILIGISNYEDAYEYKDEWWNLNCKNDIDLLYSYLTDNGFESKNIDSLTNNTATYDNVNKRLKAFIKNLEKGDEVFFYFSGHGQQVDDINDGDEKNEDNLDEALVLFDTPRFRETIINYKGEKHLKDDELNVYFTEIRSIIGLDGQLFAGIDACFSGNIHKEEVVTYKGGKTPLILSQRQESDFNDIDRDREFNVSLDSLSPFNLISASNSNKLASEIEDTNGIKYGALTYFLYKTIMQNEIRTYNELFEKTKYSMRQSNKIDHSAWFLSSGYLDKAPFFIDIRKKYKFPEKDSYYLIKTILEDEDDSIQSFNLEVGKIHGIDVNSQFNVIDRIKGDTIAIGKIIKANNFNSVILLDKALDKNSINNSAIVPFYLGTIQYEDKNQKTLNNKFYIKTDRKSYNNLLKVIKGNYYLENELSKIFGEKENSEFNFNFINDNFELKYKDSIIYAGKNVNELYYTLVKASYFYKYLNELVLKKSSRGKFKIYKEDSTNFKYRILNGNNKEALINVFSVSDTNLKVHIPYLGLNYSDVIIESISCSRYITIEKENILNNIYFIRFANNKFYFNMDKNIFSNINNTNLSLPINMEFKTNKAKKKINIDYPFFVYSIKDCKELNCSSVINDTCD